ncbi:C4-dicarboxylate transporter/malic acid transport protein [Penicillium cf. griseofulvum]|uniref:C4-dicarboxylate transporter/malic acid transport protein n=1 Tax=Penicillium cf. griseofulvum TaxID=2972120 RepID=A0A9W9IVU0_9EURO|nr:C4-dicarboxylate transporter/malic acid transport protein [Penicillium cf. griseofulvum]KAJ5430041.1 C4-dicarboxylate transporter/malic acid transport protein [Penicillium cf. griseofulvum]
MSDQGGFPPPGPLSRALWNFSSLWFIVPQGTGIIAVILYRLKYQFNGLKTLATIVWIYTIVQLGLFLILYLLRIFLHSRHVLYQLRNKTVETSCLCCISIAFTSILQMAALKYGDTAGLAIYILWWVNTGMAVLACMVIPFVHLKMQQSGKRHMQADTLMPFLAALTSAAGGGVICRVARISPRLQVPAIIVSYLELGVGLALVAAFYTIILAQYFGRPFQTPDMVYQDMIMCGPCGQASVALQALGEAIQAGSFAAYDRGQLLTAKAADPFAFISHFIGLLIWGYGIFWWFFAILSICYTLHTQPGGWKKSRFTMSVWSVVFPWVRMLISLVFLRGLLTILRSLQGTFTNAAVEFGKLMDSPTFDVFSTALLLLLVIIWIIIQIFTLKGIVTGGVFGLDHGWRKRYDDRRPAVIKEA